MINRLIELALRNRFIVIVFYVGLAGWGWWALGATPIDAIPDLSDNQVIVFTDWSGHSPQEVEDQVTYPLTTNLQGLAGVRVVRSQSAFGFSMVYVVFQAHPFEHRSHLVDGQSVDPIGVAIAERARQIAFIRQPKTQRKAARRGGDCRECHPWLRTKI